MKNKSSMGGSFASTVQYVEIPMSEVKNIFKEIIEVVKILYHFHITMYMHVKIVA